MKKKYPRVLLAAPGSGSGKTYITCGLLEALKQKGYELSAFKCGPDYIDPMFHKEVLDIPSKNLDTYFTDCELTKALFQISAKELSVIEGVMGYYDGIGGTSFEGSTYELAERLEAPVILVVDCKGMSRSVVALVKGMLEYQQNSHIAGVILNRMSPMLYEKIKAQMEEELPIKVLGYLPTQKDFVLESRHLGLKLPQEISDLQENIKKLAEVMTETIDLEGVIELANTAPNMEELENPYEMCIKELESDGLKEQTVEEEKTQIDCDNFRPICNAALLDEDTEIHKLAGKRIAIAKDAAFCFYYEDNLRLLEYMGAKLSYFSPLDDKELPLADAYLFGGGYPEYYAKQLSENIEMKAAIKNAMQAGRPVLAECGGFLYLQEKCTDIEGNAWDMVGAIAGESFYTGKLGRFGYIELTLSNGEKCKAHEFHYFDSTQNGIAAIAKKPGNGRSWKCMIQTDTLLAGFPHLYYLSNPDIITDLVKKI